VRRYFSNFAGGWPAVGLLLIRIAAGASLIIDGREQIYTDHPMSPVLLGILAIANGAVLISGLWTPLAGFLAIALSAIQFLVYHDSACPAMLLAAMGAGIALVGPGAISVDAWLFGLKRIDIDKIGGPHRW